MAIKKLVVYMVPLSTGDGSVRHSWHLTEEAAAARIQRELDDGEPFGDLDADEIDTWFGSRQHLAAVISSENSELRVRHSGGEIILRVVENTYEQEGPGIPLYTGRSGISVHSDYLKDHGIEGAAEAVWLVPDGDETVEIPVEVWYSRA